ncbi:MAG: hypothetical protein U9N34_06450 [Candidatus Cloacimonadota bacterium]|nr:hypothetical protein [Candidatus Cloacimonadota bacterium]
MKNLIVMLTIVMLIYGCNDSTAPDETPMITIEILQNGLIQETFIVTEDENGDIYPIYYDNHQIGETEIITFIQFFGIPEDDPEIYFKVISRKNNNYTKFDIVNHFDTLRIDYQQDFDNANENLNCGTMYDPSEGYIINARFSVWKDSVFIDSLFTDNLGRFETIIEPDEYLLKTVVVEESFETEIQLINGYADYFINYYLIDYKPNIYFYPQTEINLDVNISFPKSGKVVKSIPEFPDQWQNLQITPDGRINNKYDYLFYESIQPDIFQKTDGWIVKLENLSTFFKENLQKSGFNQNEINDFIEHWIPKLNDSKYYAIYPQFNKQLNPLIKLEFSQQPDNIFRLTYLITKLNSNEIKLTKPEIQSFERKGFVVTEWGLIFDERE